MKAGSKYVWASLALMLGVALSARAEHLSAHAVLYNSVGVRVGTASLDQTKEGVAIKLRIDHLPPGVHAIHIHAFGRCEMPDFKSAGPHFNPTSRIHGFDNPGGPHAGDLSNFVVDDKGEAKVTLLDRYVTLGPGPTSLFHPNGTSLVIHAHADDYVSDPTGNAGARIACGVIER